MMTPYREGAIVEDIDIVAKYPRGLVRANGVRCTCTAPGLLWCWWYDVQLNDRWFCDHGGGWLRSGGYEPKWVEIVEEKK